MKLLTALQCDGASEGKEHPLDVTDAVEEQQPQTP